MRPKFLVSLLIVVVAILVIVFWLRPVKPSITPTPIVVQGTNAPLTTANVTSQNSMSSTQPTIQINPAPSGFSNMSILAMTRKFVESKNKPIDFYGLVIDQDSNALSGAHIKSSIEQLTVADPAIFEMGIGSKKIPIERTTGADGRFEIHGVSGDSFGVLLSKDGYEAESEKNGFGGGTSGSFENPVIFKMWSTNIHEKLITGDKSFEIVPDGRLYFINLTDGTISENEGGDLKVWIQYTNQVVQGQLYDWSAGIEVVNGGLSEVSQVAMNSGFIDEFTIPMYVAPLDGYTPSFSHKAQIKGGQSGEIGNRYFYLLLNNRKEYGKMSINLFAPYGYLHPGLVDISYAINPSGSRILR